MFRSFGRSSGASSSAHRKKGETSPTSRRRTPSQPSSSSRKLSRDDGEYDGAEGNSKSSRGAYPSVDGSSGPSSYVTAPVDRASDRYDYNTTRPYSLTESAIRALSEQDEGWEDLGARDEGLGRVSLRDHDKKHRSRSLSRRSLSSSPEATLRKEKHGRTDSKGKGKTTGKSVGKARDKGKGKMVDPPSTERSLDSRSDMPRGADTFGAQIGAQAFSQFPGQYAGMYDGPSEYTPHPDMSSHVQAQFPGQDPSQYSTPAFNPNQTSSAGVYGLAADFYGDQGQSVSDQPGVRPESATIITGTQPHLVLPSAIPNPPTETGNGAAAEFFAVPASQQSQSSSKPSRPPESQNKPNKTGRPSKSSASRPSQYSNPVSASTTLADSAAVAGAPIDASYSNPYQESYASTIQGGGVPYPHGPSSSPFINPSSSRPQHYHSTSEPVVPSISDCRPTTTTKPGKQSSNSQNSLYAAGALGAAAGAYSAYENHHQTSSHHHSASAGTPYVASSHYGNHTQGPYMSGAIAMKYKHRGPISKFVDWWKDYEDVQKMEEYTEYIGVCKYCFDPHSTPADAPRKHHYHRRSSSESLRRRSSDSSRRVNSQGSKHSRVDKDARYNSSDSEKRRKKSSWLGAGIAGYGLGKLWEKNRDFEDTYSVKSGHLAGSSRVSSRSQSRSERGVISDGKRTEYAYVRSKDGTKVMRRADISRSRSRERRPGLSKGAASSIGARTPSEHNQRRPVSGSKDYERSRSRSHSPSLGEIFGFAGPRSHQRRSTANFPTDLPRRPSPPGTGVLGGLFTSQPATKRNRLQKSRKKGFFNFNNSSSSSTNSDLAFGSLVNRPRPQLKKTQRKTSDERLNETLIGLGTALTAAQRLSRKRDRRPDLVSVRQHQGSLARKEGRPERMKNPTEEEQGWESATEEESGSVSSGLAFGDFDFKGKSPARRLSTSSITSDSSGTKGWGWGRGTKQAKRNHGHSPRVSSPHDDDYAYGAGLIPSTKGGVPSRLASTARDSRPVSAASSEVPMQPMQYVHPVPTSDPTVFEPMTSSMPGTFPQQSPGTWSRSDHIPLEQPQPIFPIHQNVFASEGPSQSYYTPTSGPSTYTQQNHPAPLRRIQSSPVTSHLARDATVAAGAALATASILSNGRRRTPREDMASNVRFELTEKQAEKEERIRRYEQDREDEEKDRAEHERATRVAEERERELAARRDDERRNARELERREVERAEADRQRERERRAAEAEREAYMARVNARPSNGVGENNGSREETTSTRGRERMRSTSPGRHWTEEYEAEAAASDREHPQIQQRPRASSESRPVESQYRPRQYAPSYDPWESPAVGGMGSTREDPVLDGPSHGNSRQQMASATPAYETRVFEPSNNHNGHQVYKDDQHNVPTSTRGRRRSIFDEEEDPARQTAAQIVSDMEERYRQPAQSQAAFFAPKDIGGPAKGKTAASDPLGDNDVQVYHVSNIPSDPPPPYQLNSDGFHATDSKGKRMPWTVPKLNIIAPTPPISHAGSTHEDRSPVVSDVGQSQERDQQAEDGAARRSTSRVSWGEDQTRIYEVHTPDSSSREHDIADAYFGDGQMPGASREDMEHSAQQVGDATRDDFASGPLPSRAKTSNWPDEDAEEAPPGVEPLFGSQRPYQFPHVEDFNDLVFGLDSPGTEGAPPVQGFVEGEVDDPTPPEEEHRHMPGAFDDLELGATTAASTQESRRVTGDKELLEWAEPSGKQDTFAKPEFETVLPQAAKEPDFEVALTKKDRKRREKAAKRGLSEPSTVSSAAEPETPREVEEPFEFPLSKKEQKKRDKAAKRGSVDAGNAVQTPAAGIVPVSETRSAESAEDKGDYYLSKKDRKKRDKAVKQAPLSSADSPTIDTEEAFEFPLSKKDKKRREKMARTGDVEERRDQGTHAADDTTLPEAADDEVRGDDDDGTHAPKPKRLDLSDFAAVALSAGAAGLVAAETDKKQGQSPPFEHEPSEPRSGEYTHDQQRSAPTSTSSPEHDLAKLHTGDYAHDRHRSAQRCTSSPEEDFGRAKDVDSESRRGSVHAYSPIAASPLRTEIPRNGHTSDHVRSSDGQDSSTRERDSSPRLVRRSSESRSPTESRHVAGDSQHDSARNKSTSPQLSRRSSSSRSPTESRHRHDESHHSIDLPSPESDRDARSVVSAPTGRDDGAFQESRRKSRREQESDHGSSNRTQSLAASEPIDTLHRSKRDKSKTSRHESKDDDRSNNPPAPASEPGDAYDSSRKHKHRSKHDSDNFDDAGSAASAPISRSRHHDDDAASSKSSKERKGGIFSLFRRKSTDGAAKTQEVDRRYDDDKDSETSHRRRHHRTRSSERGARSLSRARSFHDEDERDGHRRRPSSSRHRTQADDFDDSRSQASESRRRHKHRSASFGAAATDDLDDDSRSQASESKRRHRRHHHDSSPESTRSKSRDRKSREDRDLPAIEPEKSFLGERVEAEEQHTTPLPANLPSPPTRAPESVHPVQVVSLTEEQHIPGATEPHQQINIPEEETEIVSLPENASGDLTRDVPEQEVAERSENEEAPTSEYLVVSPSLESPRTLPEPDRRVATMENASDNLPEGLPKQEERPIQLETNVEAQTPRRPIVSPRPASSTKIPLRFRFPSGSPVSPVKRSNSFSASSDQSPLSPVLPKTRQGRPKSFDLTHSVQKPSHHAGASHDSEDFKGREHLPTVPSSGLPSRASSYSNSEDYQSAVEGFESLEPATDISAPTHERFAESHVSHKEDIPDSQQTTPRASEFPRDVLDHKSTRPEPEFYTWSDYERDERMHEMAAQQEAGEGVAEVGPRPPKPTHTEDGRSPYQSDDIADTQATNAATGQDRDQAPYSDPMASDVWGDDSDVGEARIGGDEKDPGETDTFTPPVVGPKEASRPQADAKPQTLPRSKSTKKGKKGKKSKAARLGTSSSSEPATPADVSPSPQELKDRRRRDTELAVESWFDPLPADVEQEGRAADDAGVGAVEAASGAAVAESEEDDARVASAQTGVLIDRSIEQQPPVAVTGKDMKATSVAPDLDTEGEATAEAAEARALEATAAATAGAADATANLLHEDEPATRDPSHTAGEVHSSETGSVPGNKEMAAQNDTFDGSLHLAEEPGSLGFGDSGEDVDQKNSELAAADAKATDSNKVADEDIPTPELSVHNEMPSTEPAAVVGRPSTNTEAMRSLDDTPSSQAVPDVSEGRLVHEPLTEARRAVEATIVADSSSGPQDQDDSNTSRDLEQASEPTDQSPSTELAAVLEDTTADTDAMRTLDDAPSSQAVPGVSEEGTVYEPPTQVPRPMEVPTTADQSPRQHDQDHSNTSRDLEETSEPADKLADVGAEDDKPQPSSGLSLPARVLQDALHLFSSVSLSPESRRSDTNETGLAESTLPAHHPASPSAVNDSVANEERDISGVPADEQSPAKVATDNTTEFPHFDMPATLDPPHTPPKPTIMQDNSAPSPTAAIDAQPQTDEDPARALDISKPNEPAHPALMDLDNTHPASQVSAVRTEPMAEEEWAMPLSKSKSKKGKKGKKGSKALPVVQKPLDEPQRSEREEPGLSRVVDESAERDGGAGESQGKIQEQRSGDTGVVEDAARTPGGEETGSFEVKQGRKGKKKKNKGKKSESEVSSSAGLPDASEPHVNVGAEVSALPGEDKTDVLDSNAQSEDLTAKADEAGAEAGQSSVEAGGGDRKDEPLGPREGLDVSQDLDKHETTMITGHQPAPSPADINLIEEAQEHKEPLPVITDQGELKSVEKEREATPGEIEVPGNGDNTQTLASQEEKIDGADAIFPSPAAVNDEYRGEAISNDDGHISTVAEAEKVNREARGEAVDLSLHATWPEMNKPEVRNEESSLMGVDSYGSPKETLTPSDRSVAVQNATFEGAEQLHDAIPRDKTAPGPHATIENAHQAEDNTPTPTKEHFQPETPGEDIFATPLTERQVNFDREAPSTPWENFETPLEPSITADTDYFERRVPVSSSHGITPTHDVSGSQTTRTDVDGTQRQDGEPSDAIIDEDNQPLENHEETPRLSPPLDDNERPRTVLQDFEFNAPFLHEWSEDTDHKEAEKDAAMLHEGIAEPNEEEEMEEPHRPDLIPLPIPSPDELETERMQEIDRGLGQDGGAEEEHGPLEDLPRLEQPGERAPRPQENGEHAPAVKDSNVHPSKLNQAETQMRTAEQTDNTPALEKADEQAETPSDTFPLGSGTKQGDHRDEHHSAPVKLSKKEKRKAKKSKGAKIASPALEEAGQAAAPKRPLATTVDEPQTVSETSVMEAEIVPPTMQSEEDKEAIMVELLEGTEEPKNLDDSGQRAIETNMPEDHAAVMEGSAPVKDTRKSASPEPVSQEQELVLQSEQPTEEPEHTLKSTVQESTGGDRVTTQQQVEAAFEVPRTLSKKEKKKAKKGKKMQADVAETSTQPSESARGVEVQDMPARSQDGGEARGDNTFDGDALSRDIELGPQTPRINESAGEIRDQSPARDTEVQDENDARTDKPLEEHGLVPDIEQEQRTSRIDESAREIQSQSPVLPTSSTKEIPVEDPAQIGHASDDQFKDFDRRADPVREIAARPVKLSKKEKRKVKKTRAGTGTTTPDTLQSGEPFAVERPENELPEIAADTKDIDPATTADAVTPEHEVGTVAGVTSEVDIEPKHTDAETGQESKHAIEVDSSREVNKRDSPDLQERHVQESGDAVGGSPDVEEPVGVPPEKYEIQVESKEQEAVMGGNGGQVSGVQRSAQPPQDDFGASSEGLVYPGSNESETRYGALERSDLKFENATSSPTSADVEHDVSRMTSTEDTAPDEETSGHTGHRTEMLPTDLPETPAAQSSPQAPGPASHDETGRISTPPPASPPPARTDIDFAATLAAGLTDSGFDSNLVLNDPTFHRRASPPGVAEADPEEVAAPTTRRNRDVAVSEDSGSRSPSNVENGKSFENDAQDAQTQLHNATRDSPGSNDGFSDALAAGLVASGFAANVLSGPDLGGSVSDEPEVSLATSRKRKNRKKKVGGGESLSRTGSDETVGGPISESPLAQVPSAQAQVAYPGASGDFGGIDPTEIKPMSGEADAGLPHDSTGGSEKGDAVGSLATHDQHERQTIDLAAQTPTIANATETPNRVSTLFPNLKRVARRTLSTTSRDSGDRETSNTDNAAPRGFLHTSEISQTLPVAIESPTNQDIEEEAQADLPNNRRLETQVDEPHEPGVPYAEKPTWSFSDPHRADARPLDTSRSINMSPPQTPVRDSGYHDDDTSHSSINKFDMLARGKEPLENLQNTGVDPFMPAGGQHEAPASQEKNVDHQDEPLSPFSTPSAVESTTKDRTSYLFSSPPDIKSVPPPPLTRISESGARSRGSAEHGMTTFGNAEIAQRTLENDPSYVPMELPGRKKSRDITDVGTPEQGVKTARRGDTPPQAFRKHLNLPEGELDPRPDTRTISPHASDMLGSQSEWSPNEEDANLNVIQPRRAIGNLRSASAQSNRSIAESSRDNMQASETSRPPSAASNNMNRSSTPQGPTGLRRIGRSLSGDLRAASRRSDAPGPKTIAFEPPPTPPPQDGEQDDVANGRASGARATDMADIYEGWGDGHSPSASPTRPPSMRKRQSMHIIDLETRLDQLTAENRELQNQKDRIEQQAQNVPLQQLSGHENLQQALEARDLQLREKDNEINQIKAILEPLQQEIAELKEINGGLTEANKNLIDDTNHRYAALQAECAETQQQWEQANKELVSLRQRHDQLSGGMETIVRQEISIALEDKNAEIRRLREELEVATSQIRELQNDILASNKDDYLVARDEDYFDNACQKLCQHVQQWVLRFSKYSDNRMCRLTSDLMDEKIEARLDNSILDGSDVDKLLGDRVRRRDIFMSVVMSMIWEYVFTRYLFGMDREQRQKLKTLEKILAEVGPPRAVAHWRATTLTLLSRRPAFATQRALDTEAVAQEILSVLSALLPPPTQLEAQILASLRNVLRLAVDLAIEMRCQRAEFIMLPPLQPEYDNQGDLVRKVHFNAALMNERSGAYTSNDELERTQAVVKVVLFPLVVKKGDDNGEGEDEIVVCPAQVLVAGSKVGKKVVRVLSGAMDIDQLGSRRASSKLSLVSGMDTASNMTY